MECPYSQKSLMALRISDIHTNNNIITEVYWSSSVHWTFSHQKSWFKTIQSSWIICQFKLSNVSGVHVGRPCESERGKDLVTKKTNRADCCDKGLGGRELWKWSLAWMTNWLVGWWAKQVRGAENNKRREEKNITHSSNIRPRIAQATLQG